MSRTIRNTNLLGVALIAFALRGYPRSLLIAGKLARTVGVGPVSGFYQTDVSDAAWAIIDPHFASSSPLPTALGLLSMQSSISCAPIARGVCLRVAFQPGALSITFSVRAGVWARQYRAVWRRAAMPVSHGQTTKMMSAMATGGLRLVRAQPRLARITNISYRRQKRRLKSLQPASRSDLF
jgi:hypothetical protein